MTRNKKVGFTYLVSESTEAGDIIVERNIDFHCPSYEIFDSLGWRSVEVFRKATPLEEERISMAYLELR